MISNISLTKEAVIHHTRPVDEWVKAGTVWSRGCFTHVGSYGFGRVCAASRESDLGVTLGVLGAGEGWFRIRRWGMKMGWDVLHGVNGDVLTHVFSVSMLVTQWACYGGTAACVMASGALTVVLTARAVLTISNVAEVFSTALW